MSCMYQIPAQFHRHETLVSRSRFITSIAHAASADEANAFIAQIKTEFPDASHNCWAYVAGAPADSARVGMSDDGEPHGTAGKPMLNVLLHCEVGEIVAVVTRYFGGTKLGTGGLVKAYSGAVQAALLDLPSKTKRDLASFQLTLEYSQIGAAKNLIESIEGNIVDECFEADVRLTVEIPVEHSDSFIQAIQNLTKNEDSLKTP